MKETIGLYWGRFNPPHKGHITLIKKLLKKVDKLIIAIGSAQEKNTKRNPFSAEERRKMIQAYLEEKKINPKKFKIIIVNDGKTHNSSINNLLKKSGAFDILFTDKKMLIKLISKKIKVSKTKRAGTVSSTKIKEAIAKDSSWEKLTGRTVARLIKKFNGIKRIKKAYGIK